MDTHFTEVPAVDLAGWYEPGPHPGEAGPAVIVGHVDSRRGPAVFWGSFDRATGHHRDNVIVYGNLANLDTVI